MKRAALLLALALALLVAVLFARALPRGTEVSAPPPAAGLRIDTQAVARRLSEVIRIPTITDDQPGADSQQFAQLRTLLEREYPRVHAALPREIIAGHSLLFTWAGSEPALPPMLLMGHMDVVPVVAGSETDWTYPPFSGALANGEVWGRGALDDKQHVIALLDAAELLLAEGLR
ncbi:MAG: M20/M25/M40 family metallo-hydrolase, partial [Longimicrobiales bacterium]